MNTVKFKNKLVIPSKVICIGRNYVGHIKELNNEMPSEPVIFIKPNSAVTQTLSAQQGNDNHAIHYEAELSLLIENGRFVAVSAGLDLTKRDVQSQLKVKGLPWERSKSFDGAAVFSEFVEFNNIEDLSLLLSINGQITQQANFDLMIHKPEALLNDVTSVFSVEDFDILMTGTPKGVGVVNLGDRFELKILEANELLILFETVAE
ncbi:fumarylacetoacetate hydrolase family protein [Marinicellulosiphila megalodicopiae]|uniref:fumarylacetoacetate hydrolase family protein n=1 Tax=Marinicellulosiphila megalodicopiae TaxID=2724896 RepID=UPI003BAEE4C3